ncbi:hypothetical protein N7536_001817 [Penicillium majusculum]|uniref:G-patch domain-containing protein n=1 Tax=Penicillium solitum TaxID=60172 RepID=A0A1V6QY31_9EURO|nr:uncharacterized protein PENSOL_c029G12032 [Penicillium solitum]KAJ5706128.1 hypothetical protein N7536_001817 [Penicillium majusculum]OQD93906.1 hypothetical protein PENSOL_c029G12032 [Penicillium solitum]
MASEDEDYFLPPEQQRPFSSGIRRKRVQFVRSSDLDTTTTPTPSSSSGTSIADKYLSIVMGQTTASTSPSTPTQRAPSPPIRTHSAPPTQDIIPPRPLTEPAPAPAPATEYCEVCKLPVPKATENETDKELRPHEASLAHQICLTHSHPPSHLDRTRSGLRYLSTYGWDPDSRLGLGASGREGIREPIKPRAKHGTAGLGTGLDRDGDPLPPRPAPVKVQKLNAKQARNKIAEDKKRAERIRKTFYQNDEVLKYLGEGA